VKRIGLLTHDADHDWHTGVNPDELSNPLGKRAKILPVATKMMANEASNFDHFSWEGLELARRPTPHQSEVARSAEVEA